MGQGIWQCTSCNIIMQASTWRLQCRYLCFVRQVANDERREIVWTLHLYLQGTILYSYSTRVLYTSTSIIQAAKPPIYDVSTLDKAVPEVWQFRHYIGSRNVRVPRPRKNPALSCLILGRPWSIRTVRKYRAFHDRSLSRRLIIQCLKEGSVNSFPSRAVSGRLYMPLIDTSLPIDSRSC